MTVPFLLLPNRDPLAGALLRHLCLEFSEYPEHLHHRLLVRIALPGDELEVLTDDVQFSVLVIYNAFDSTVQVSNTPGDTGDAMSDDDIDLAGLDVVHQFDVATPVSVGAGGFVLVAFEVREFGIEVGECVLRGAVSLAIEFLFFCGNSVILGYGGLFLYQY